MSYVLRLGFGMWVAVCFWISGPAVLLAQDSLVSVPFSRAPVVTEAQRAAWIAYLDAEAAQRGCVYSDDPRLSEDPKGLLSAIMAGETQDPVRLTYRTWRQLPDSIRDILSRSLVISSLDCQPVYAIGDGLVGAPAISFEEMWDLLTQAVEADDQDALLRVIREARLAPMDARWFFALFGVPRDQLALIGIDQALLDRLEDRLPRLVDLTASLTDAQVAMRRNHPGTETIADIAFFYLQFPGARLTLPSNSPCELVIADVPPSLTIWPDDDPMTDRYAQPSPITDPIESDRAMGVRAWNMRERLINLYTPYEQVELVKKPAHWQYNDSPVPGAPAFRLGANIEDLTGPRFSSYAYRQAGECNP